MALFSRHQVCAPAKAHCSPWSRLPLVARPSSESIPQGGAQGAGPLPCSFYQRVSPSRLLLRGMRSWSRAGAGQHSPTGTHLVLGPRASLAPDRGLLISSTEAGDYAGTVCAIIRALILVALWNRGSFVKSSDSTAVSSIFIHFFVRGPELRRATISPLFLASHGSDHAMPSLGCSFVRPTLVFVFASGGSGLG